MGKEFIHVRAIMKYVAFFRGINVGGKNLIKMDDLKQLFLDLGLSKTKTYIQSGNVVFETDSEERPLLKTIQAGVVERFGLECTIILRNIKEMKTFIDQLPYSQAEIAAAEAADPQVEHLYACFLEHLPEQTLLEELRHEYAGSDQLKMGQRDLYLLCRQSIRNSKLAIRTANVFNSATVRNWKTVKKVYAMLASL